jgi:hypothetical protein
MNSCLSRDIPSSSISTKRGVSTYNKLGSMLEISILKADIYPSPSESSLSNIFPKFINLFLSIILFVFL